MNSLLRQNAIHEQDDAVHTASVRPAACDRSATMTAATTGASNQPAYGQHDIVVQKIAAWFTTRSNPAT